MFSCEYYKIFKNSIFYRNAASGKEQWPEIEKKNTFNETKVVSWENEDDVMCRKDPIKGNSLREPFFSSIYFMLTNKNIYRIWTMQYKRFINTLHIFNNVVILTQTYTNQSQLLTPSTGTKATRVQIDCFGV